MHFANYLSKLLVATIVAVMAIVNAGRTHADIVVIAQEIGGDVVITGSGSLDLTDTVFETTVQTVASVEPFDSLVVGPANSTSVEFYTTTFTSGPSSYGPGTADIPADFGVGDMFGLDFGPNGLAVPVNYVSGDFLSSSSTYAGHTFESLGMTPGSYTWTWGSGASADSFTLNAIPEPNGTAILVVTGIGIFMRRRRDSRIFRNSHGRLGSLRIKPPEQVPDA